MARPLDDLRSAGAFTSTLDQIAGKKVAVIGHFPGLEKARDCCDLTILEREPEAGDLPDFAAEYVLPQQDCVFITGSTLTNKTLPRLLELSAGATVALVGPSVPLVPWWFDSGVDLLAGTVVTNKAGVWERCLEGAHKGIFSCRRLMVDIRRDEMRNRAARTRAPVRRRGDVRVKGFWEGAVLRTYCVVVAAFVVLTLTLGVAACGSDSAGSTDTRSRAPSSPTRPVVS